MTARLLVLLTVLAVPGCADTPASLGITGPGLQAPPTQPDENAPDTSGVPYTPGPFAPTIGPSPSTDRYFNYN